MRSITDKQPPQPQPGVGFWGGDAAVDFGKASTFGCSTSAESFEALASGNPQ